MESLDCFDLHDLVLNDDDDIQDAYVSFIYFVRTYVFLMLRTYVMILCNWLIV